MSKDISDMERKLIEKKSRECEELKKKAQRVADRERNQPGIPGLPS